MAVLAAVLAALLRWALAPVLGFGPPYITFYLAVVVAAAYGGRGPGLLATALGALLGIALAAPPMGGITLFQPAEQVRLALYLLSGAGISLIAGALARARSVAEQEARRKDEFLAVLSHELRNPLAPLTNAHRLIERTVPLTEQRRAALAMAQRQTRQLSRLVDDLLEVSRIANASKYTPDGGAIGVDARRSVDQVEHVVELHGGTVAVESGGRSRGSTFTVRLPTSASGPAVGASRIRLPRGQGVAAPRER